MDERLAQYFILYSWLFWPTVEGKEEEEEEEEEAEEEAEVEEGKTRVMELI